jgi:hypothetical protein
LKTNNNNNNNVRSEAFAATVFNKIFLGDQQRQMNKRNRRFEDRLSLYHQGCYVIEMSVSFIHLTLLIAQEDFIE